MKVNGEIGSRQSMEVLKFNDIPYLRTSVVGTLFTTSVSARQF